MRNHEEVRKKPSMRQTQAIPQLLSARYFRNGQFTLDDFIDAAVFTTYPLDQDIARVVAEDIVLGRKQEEEAPSEQQGVAAKLQSTDEDKLSAVIAQIKREQALRDVIKKDKVEAGYEYLQDLKQRGQSDLYQASQDYLSDGDIVLRGISSDEQLKSVASSELLDRMGNLTSRDIENSQTLGSLDDVAQSPSQAEKVAAKALRGDPDVEEAFSDLARRDPTTAARSLRMMEEMGAPDKDTLSSMDQELQKNIENLSQSASYSSELGRDTDHINDLVSKAPEDYTLDQAMDLAESIKNHTGNDHSADVMKAFNERYDAGASNKVDPTQLAQHAMDNQDWRDLVDKVTDDMTQKAKSRATPTDFLMNTLAQMSSLRDKMGKTNQAEHWEDAMQRVTDEAVNLTQTKTHLRKTVRQASRMGSVPSRKGIEEAGKRLGMTEDEILELVNPSFQVIKSLIKAGVSDFDRLHSLISSAGLTQKQLRELADTAQEMGNQSAMGAIAHVDFGAALGGGMKQGAGYGYGRPSPMQAGQDKERTDMVFGGLLGGPATNIVKIWYSYRDALPPELKQRLKLIAKKLLIDLGMRFARQTMGSSMLGGIQQSTTVRPFRIGDDIDLIDLEETIDYLLSSGRTTFDAVDPEDFLITETYQGQRAFFWALDKSGSMHDPNKLGMLAISVMAGLYGVQQDDFGVVLFDSTTHIVKEITDKTVSVDKVASDLLDVRASGGTGGRQSMRLALDNLEKSRAKEKCFIFNTDMYLSDQAECEKLAGLMKQQDIRVIILVPKTSYDPQSSMALAKAAHGVYLPIESIEELPTKLLQLTNY
ncbi:hypothetical protein EU546_05790 [Candidatus Thorarchaeota archaeon]|nr:MAG: hypothetical protein EU546_05790 [Candidatus Thorarchaeota archaeon]